MTPSSVQELPLSDLPRPDKVLLRDGADIRRLALRLATRWTVPRIDISTDRLPTLTAQRIKDRYVRLRDGCDCMLGETLGGTILMVGMCTVWITDGGVHQLGWVLIAALDAAMVGKGIELLWTRLRLLWVLYLLRRRLDAPEEANPQVPPRYARMLARLQARPVATDATTRAVPARHRRSRAPRPKVVLRDARDIHRLCLRLLSHWTPPRIEIRIDGLATRDEQRAQHRYVRLCEGSTFLPAAVFASLTLLGGLMQVVWTKVPEWVTSKRADWWLLTPGWGDVQPVVLAALAAAVLGWAVERVLARLRLVWMLRGLARKIPSRAPE